MARTVVATVEEIPPGGRKIVEVAGRLIGVFNVDGEFFALRNRCPHQGGPLCSGKVAGLVQSTVPGDYSYSRPGEMLRCPWHGWEYDIRTGQSWWDPGRTRVRSYDVTIEAGGQIDQDSNPPAPGLEKGPYVAETYPVSVERQYVVVSVEV
jgi:3-phenylpropionate/trans-cinnamate dioxygenase ferredoxin subunit